jgi:hypothetical protein
MVSISLSDAAHYLMLMMSRPNTVSELVEIRAIGAISLNALAQERARSADIGDRTRFGLSCCPRAVSTAR